MYINYIYFKFFTDKYNIYFKEYKKKSEIIVSTNN